MARQEIDLGLPPEQSPSGQGGEGGDSARTAFLKVNQMTNELYTGKADTTDPRLADAREWTAATVVQSEAEAGVATTRRAWTAQRVRQAIVAWWNSVTSTFGRSFVAAANPAGGRAALELGTAATLNTQASNGNGSFGFGGVDPVLNGAVGYDLNNITASAFYTFTGGGLVNGIGGAPSTHDILHLGNSLGSGRSMQFGHVTQTENYSIRCQVSGVWNPWRQLWHTGNLVKQSSSLDTTAGALMAVGAFGVGGYSARVNDANALPANGIYYSSSWTGGWKNFGHLSHIAVDAQYAVQTFYGATENSRGLATRVKDAGVWGAWIEFWNSGNSSALPASIAIGPATDNAISAARSAVRYSVVYAATSTISTSDAREKTPVRQLTDIELDAAIALADELGAYQWLYAIDEKGNWARDHIGMTVQRAIEVMESHGLEPFNYGFICYDQWPDEFIEHPAEYEQIEVPAVLDDDGNELEPARVEHGELISEASSELVRAAGDRYSFRGEELQAFILAGLAARQRRIEQRLAALEAQSPEQS